MACGVCSVAIRIGTLPDSELIAHKLPPYDMVICAAPAYLARAGIPHCGADLRRHECLGFARWPNTTRWESLLRLSAAHADASASSRLLANSGQALRTAALRGFGIIMQPRVLLHDDLAAGRLVPILAQLVPKPRPVHVVYHRDRRDLPKVRSFVQLLIGRSGKRRTRALRSSAAARARHCILPV